MIVSLLTALALAGSALPPAPSTEAFVSWTETSHTVTVTYEEQRGDLRRATVRIAPRDGARPTWRGDLAAVALYGGAKHGWIVVDRLRATDRGVYEARAALPGPREIQAFAIRTVERESRVWVSPSTQTGTPPEEPPKDPEPPDTDPPGGPPAEPPGEPPTDEPPPEDDIRDPWGDGGSSDDGVRDPWGDQSTSATSLRFSI